MAAYRYDAWGNCIKVTNDTGTDIGTKNPFRYRGYYYDEESGLYYVNSRYYSPELCRFINADSQINGDILGTNLFAYCSNNPVNREDTSGQFWDVFLDIASTAYSLWQVVQNPQDISNWAALGADVACLMIPGATGGGTAVRAANIADDVIDAGRAVKAADRAGDVVEAAGKAAKTGWRVGAVLCISNSYENLLPVTPWVHAEIDKYRHFNPR